LPERTRLRRGKRGPVEAYFSGLQRDNGWIELLKHNAIVDRGYIDREAWHQAIDRARAGACASLPGFLQSCMLAAWFARLDRAPSRSPLADRDVPEPKPTSR